MIDVEKTQNQGVEFEAIIESWWICCPIGTPVAVALISLVIVLVLVWIVEIILKVPVPLLVEAFCIINMDSAILETDLEVVGVKAGRCVFNTILGDAGCEILLCFMMILEVFAAIVILLLAHLNFCRGDCCRSWRWLNREICGVQILIIKVDRIDVKVWPVLVSFELKGRDAALSTKVVDAHISRIQRHIHGGSLSGLIKH